MSYDNYLLAAVQKLTQPYTTKVLQSKNDITCISDVAHEPLLIQLRDAVAGGIGKHAGSSAARERIPFDAGALELYDRITKSINEKYLALTGQREHVHVTDRLSAWYVDFENRRRAGKVALEVERAETKLVERWAHDIESMFDPPRVFEVTERYEKPSGQVGDRPVACPECGERYAINARTGNREVAIVVEYRNEGVDVLDNAEGSCRFCGAVWRGRDPIRYLRWGVENADTQV